MPNNRTDRNTIAHMRAVVDSESRPYTDPQARYPIARTAHGERAAGAANAPTDQNRQA